MVVVNAFFFSRIAFWSLYISPFHTEEFKRTQVYAIYSFIHYVLTEILLPLTVMCIISDHITREKNKTMKLNKDNFISNDE